MTGSPPRALAGATLVAASATAFGALPFFALAAYRHGVTVSTLLAIRFGLASLIFFAHSWLSASAPKSAGPLARTVRAWSLPPGSLGVLVALGLLYCLHSSMYLRAVRYIPPAMAALIFYAYPALVTAMAAIASHQRLTLARLAPALASAMGLVLVLGFSGGGLRLRGVVLAGLTAVAYAVYIMVSERAVHKAPATLVSAYVSAFASVSLLGVGMVTNELSLRFDPGAWVSIVGLTLTSSVVGMLGMFKGIQLIGPARASVISTIEPVVTAVLGVWLLGQHLGPMQLLGGLLVFSGAVAASGPLASP